jgi:hypothetical protein
VVRVAEDVASLSRRIRRLEDVEAIRSLWFRYMSLFDRGGAHVEIASMFTENAVLESRGSDNGDRAWSGRAEIEAGFLRVVSPARAVEEARVHSNHHGTTNEVVVDGDDARLDGCFFEMTGRGAGTLLAVAGTHELALRRTGGRWSIARLVIRIGFCAQFDTVEPRTAHLGKPPER